MSREIKKIVSCPLFDEKIILNKDTSCPKISIVTPSYNQVQFLERTILSVLNQNYPNLEYIIMDGGSTDKSVEIIKKYEKYLTYWVSKKDKGQSDAINKGFQKSTGEILAYINSDDTYLPETFSKIIKAFQKNSKADLIFGNIYLINPNDEQIRDIRFTKFNFSNYIYERGGIAQPATFWRQKIYKKVGGINAKYKFCMDFDFFSRIATIGNIIFIREYLANFRIHKKSKSSTIKEIGLLEHEKIEKKYLPNNINKTYVKYRYRLYQVKRFFSYIFQGDIDYALRGIIRRLSKKFKT